MDHVDSPRAPLGVLTSFFLALAPARAEKTGPLKVTYYYLPGRPICEKIKPAVSGLESEYKGRVPAPSCGR